jgi:hypothetical protein
MSATAATAAEAYRLKRYAALRSGSNLTTRLGAYPPKREPKEFARLYRTRLVLIA